MEQRSRRTAGIRQAGRHGSVVIFRFTSRLFTMIKTKLAHAIAMAVTGTALSLAAVSGASASTTMYNTFHTSVSSATDGWTTTKGNAQLPADVAVGSAVLQPWLGTAGMGFQDTRPFNYTGQAALSWAVQLNGTGDTALVSAAESTNYASDPNYNGPAEIDTGGGAWQDNSATPTGWKHQTDLGLIRSDVTQTVTLKLMTLGNQSPTFSTFGVTIFEGMDNTVYDAGVPQTKYSHHGSWNCPTCAVPKNSADSNPWYRLADGTIVGTGMTNILYSNAVDAVNGISFTAEAGKIYTIALGGVGFSSWNTGVDGYVLGVNTAPSNVPIPAAVWLFGSALAGLGVIGRRKDPAAVPA
jgi:hypothetical protein